MEGRGICKAPLGGIHLALPISLSLSLSAKNVQKSVRFLSVVQDSFSRNARTYKSLHACACVPLSLVDIKHLIAAEQADDGGGEEEEERDLGRGDVGSWKVGIGYWLGWHLLSQEAGWGQELLCY